uniref:Uncharacterized protein n=1 Tax=Eutreptiella gymnastica TaxID=73025 RepID=A0A7S4G0S2_9EUGL
MHSNAPKGSCPSAFLDFFSPAATQVDTEPWFAFQGRWPFVPRDKRIQIRMQTPEGSQGAAVGQSQPLCHLLQSQSNCSDCSNTETEQHLQMAEGGNRVSARSHTLL